MNDLLSSTDFDLESNRLDQLASQQAWGMDNQLHVRFSKHAELNSFETKKQGRKIFVEHVYITILAPANRLNEIHCRATDEHRARFSKQFRAFLDNAEVLQVGTPLGELPSISASQVLELKHLKMDTVEQLAGMADTVAQLLGTGGIELKRRAQTYLDSRQNSEVQADRIRTLEEQLALLMAERAVAIKAESEIRVIEHTEK